MTAEPAAFVFLHSNRRVVHACGALDRLPDLAEEFGCGRPVLVADAFFLGGPVEARLRELLGPALRSFAVPQHEPDADSVEACRAFLAEAPFDLLVALGGGSALDTAKVARMLLSNPGEIVAIAGPVGVKMRPHPSLLACVPTTAGTGSEVSESAVVGAADSDYKMIFRSAEMTAQVALLDPLLSVSAPPGVTAASGYDAVTHAVEAFTSRAASVMSDPFALSAMGLLAGALPRAFAEPEDLHARSDCLVGSLQAAIAFNSANLGLAHAISGALGALHHTGHGLANALALPWTMTFNQPVLGEKGEIVAGIFGGATAGAALSRLRWRLGLDRSLDEVIPGPDALDAIASAASRSGQVRMNPRPAGVPELRALLEHMRQPTGGEQPRLEL